MFSRIGRASIDTSNTDGLAYRFIVTNIWGPRRGSLECVFFVY